MNHGKLKRVTALAITGVAGVLLGHVLTRMSMPGTHAITEDAVLHSNPEAAHDLTARLLAGAKTVSKAVAAMSTNYGPALVPEENQQAILSALFESGWFHEEGDPEDLRNSLALGAIGAPSSSLRAAYMHLIGKDVRGVMTNLQIVARYLPKESDATVRADKLSLLRWLAIGSPEFAATGEAEEPDVRALFLDKFK